MLFLFFFVIMNNAVVGKFTFSPTFQNISVGQFTRNIIIELMLMSFYNHIFISLYEKENI